MVVAVVASVAVWADGLTLGTYNAEGYNAGYVAASAGRLSIYVEREPELPYDLWIGTYQLAEGVAAVVRHDSPNWWRPGIKVSHEGWAVQVLAGTNGSPTWLDVFTPSVKLCDDLTVEGHLRFAEAGKPNWWVGPSYQRGRFSAFYHANLRSAGSWEGGVNYHACDW
jgi:hypothetical protein